MSKEFVDRLGTVPIQERPWARIWTLIAGVLNLPSFPFGTGIGVYAIWFFVRDVRV